MSDTTSGYRDRRARRSRSSPPGERPRNLLPPKDSSSLQPTPRASVAPEGSRPGSRQASPPPTRSTSRATASSTRQRYASAVPSAGAGEIIRPASRSRNDDDAVSTGEDDDIYMPSPRHPIPGPDAVASLAQQGGEGGVPVGDSSPQEAQPPPPSQPATSEATASTLHRLAEFFLLNDPPRDDDMDDGTLSLIGAAVDRLGQALAGSDWASFLGLRQPESRSPSPPRRRPWADDDHDLTPRRDGSSTPFGGRAYSPLPFPPPPPGSTWPPVFGSLGAPAGSTNPQGPRLGSPAPIRSPRRSGRTQRPPTRPSDRPGPPPDPEPMDLDRSAPAPPPPAPVRPRPQPARPTVPYQRDNPKGLPSNPKDVRAKPKIARPFVVVARKGKVAAQTSRAEALVSLAKAMPNAAPSSIVKALNTVEGTSSSSKGKGTPSYTTQGPTRRQVLVEFKTRDGRPPRPPFAELSNAVNDALMRARSQTRVLSGALAYQGWAFQTSHVPSTLDLDLIRGLICARYPDQANTLWVGLPRSKSYLKIVDVPFFSDPVLAKRTTPEDVDGAFQRSPLHDDYRPDAAARIVRESHSSTRATVYFNVWDSQSGARAKRLINKRIMIHGHECFIRAAAANPGVPLCQRCWKWGHPTKACRGRVRCPICGEPHTEEEHRHVAGCCKGNPGANPPVPPTPSGEPCPHSFRCLNCRKEGHSVMNRKCPFWSARFDRAKVDALYAKVRAFQELGRRFSNTVRS